MQIIVNRSDLAGALAAARGFVKRPSPNTLLGCVLLATSADSAAVTVEATNVDSAVRLRLEQVQVERAGAVAVGCEELLSVVNTMGDDETIALSTVGGGLSVKGSQANLSLPSAAPDGFPRWTDAGEGTGAGVAVSGETLARMVRQTAALAEDRYPRFPAMKGILVRSGKGRIAMVGSDGTGLAIATAPAAGAVDIVLSREFLNKAVRAVGEEESVTILQDGNRVLFRSDRIDVRGTQVEGEYPPYETIVPDGPGLTRAEVTTELLDRVMTQACLVAADESGEAGTGTVVVEAKPGTGLVLGAKSVRGSADVSVAVAVRGEAIRIGLPAGHLRDGVRAAAVDEVLLEFYAPNRAIRLTAGDTYQYVLMPRSLS